MKKTAFKIHSWFALLCLAPLLVISLTGSVLVFKAEIDRLLMSDKVKVHSTSVKRLPMESLHNIIVAAHPDYVVGTWEFFDDGVQADIAYLIKKGSFDWYKVYIDAYSGIIQSEPVPLDHYLTDWLLSLHYTFLLGDAGLIVGALFALVMLILGITGLIIYGKNYRRLFTIRWQRAYAVLFSDLHKTVGVISSPILLVLGFTGLYWNIAEALHEYVEHAEHETEVIHAPLYNLNLPFQRMLEHAPQYLDGFTPTYFVFAYEQDMQIMLFGHVRTGNPLYSDYSSGIVFDKYSGEQVSTWDIRSSAALTKITDTFRHLHFGSFGGLTSRIVYSVIGAMPLLLSITGVYLWWHRKNKKNKSRRRRQSIG